jgi:AbrB family looped-hinge helix DNA binding protein
MFATLTSKGQITLPKAIRDQLDLQAGSILDFELMPDQSISVRAVKADARRLRGLLKSPHPAALSVEQMDDGVEAEMRERHPPQPKAGSR